MLAAIGCTSIAAAAWSADFAGRRLVDVLGELRGQGINLIYNSETLSVEWLIAREPTARDGEALAREILAEFGLGLQPVAANTFSIVRLPDNRNGASDAASSPPPPPQESAVLAEIVVQSSRYRVSGDGVEVSTALSQSYVNRLPRLGDETLRAIQRLPGAASNGWQTLSAIRGGAPNETGIVLDGMRLYEPFHLKNFLSPMSVLDARLIENMDVHAGGFPVEFGDRMSAIIDAHTVRPTAARYFELGLSAFHASGLASFAFDDDAARLLVTARRSNLGELARFSEQDFGRPTYSDGFGRLDYAFDPTLRMSFNALLSHDEIVARKEGGQQTTQAEYGNNYVWTTWSKDWQGGATTQLLLGYTDIANDRVGAVANTGLREATVVDQRRFHIANLRIDHRWQTSWFDRPLTHSSGVEVRRLEGEYRYRSDVSFAQGYPFPTSLQEQETNVINVDPDGDELTAYWDTRWDISSRWAVNAGIRFDDQSEYFSEHFTQWSPRLGLLFAPTTGVRMRLSWGRFFQAQAINELQVEDGVDHFSRPQDTDHFIASVEQHIGEVFTWRVEAYRKTYRTLQTRYENLFDPLSLLPEVEFDRVAISPSSARTEGIEVILNARLAPNWNIWLNYARSRARDRIDGTDQYRSWDQPHALNAGLVWTQGLWAFTLADSYHTGWPTTSLELVNNRPQFGPRNAERLGAFHSVDARIARTTVLPHGELDFFLEATNLLDRKNDCCVDYTAIRGTNGSVVLNRSIDHWLQRVPSAGVLWRY